MVKRQPEIIAAARVYDREKLCYLAKSAILGGREELESLCENITRDILFRVMRVIPDNMDAEDVAQNILIRVCENIYGLKKPEAFGGWLNTIINNEINRYFSNSSRRENVVSIEDFINAAVPDALVEDSIENMPSEYVIREDERRIIMSFIDKLPNRQLEAILLHYFEGMSVTETAKAMGVTQQAASRYIVLGKKKIKTDIHMHMNKTSSMQRFSVMAVGPLLTQVMCTEAAMLPEMNRAFIENVVEAGLTNNVTRDAALARAGKSLRNFAAGITTTLSVTAIIFGLWVGSQIAQIDTHMYMPIDTQGEIIFMDNDMKRVITNPVYAVVWARNERGELFPLQWQIKQADGENVLYSGEGCISDVDFAQVLKASEAGEYTLMLSMEDAAGSTYTVYKNFWVENID